MTASRTTNIGRRCPIHDGVPFLVSSGAVTLRGERWPGAAGAATAVLVPGGGQSRSSWHRTASRLVAESFGVLTVDLRGHGDSDRAEDRDYSATAFAADLRAVCAAVDGPTVLVGASMAGLAGLLATEGSIGVVDGLVMVDIAIDSRVAGVDRVRTFLRRASAGFDTLEELASSIAEYTGRPSPPAERIRTQTRRSEDGRWFLHWDPAFAGHEPDFDAVRDRLIAAARALRVPAMLVRGARSDVVTDQEAAAMTDLLPRLKIVNVADAGHMISGDDNDVFTDSLSGFLRAIAA